MRPADAVAAPTCMRCTSADVRANTRRSDAHDKAFVAGESKTGSHAGAAGRSADAGGVWRLRVPLFPRGILHGEAGTRAAGGTVVIRHPHISPHPGSPARSACGAGGGAGG